MRYIVVFNILSICILYNLNIYAQLLPNEDLEEIQATAKKGSAHHQAVLGEIYRRGFPLERDLTKAFALFKESAGQGNGLAYYNLSIMYENGYGTFKDTSKANYYKLQCLEPLRKLAEENNARAIFAYGVIFDDKIDSLKNNAIAGKLYRKAASLGHPIALSNIAVHFQYGLEIEKNIDSAIYYYKKSKELNYPYAYTRLGNIFFDEKHDTVRAIKHYKKAVQLSEPTAMGTLGTYYNRIEKYDKALYYYKLAAENGKPKDKRKLALIYESGELTERNYNKAFSLFKLASEQYDVFSTYKLGWYYAEGLGIKKNIETAQTHFTIAKEHGHPQAARALEVMEFLK